MSRYSSILVLIIVSLLFLCPGRAFSVCASPSVTDYTAYPPFITAGVKPNLLLMFDNSSSQYDLAYVDTGSANRKPYYCYDQTYSSANAYQGYFEPEKYYAYSFTDDYFHEITTMPSGCGKNIPSALCIEGTNLDTIAAAKTITGFSAKGNYLNWLTASKIDLQKKILTGGKYDTGNQLLVPESRGCLGWGFIKEALTSDYSEGGVNTSLKITFRIKGPPDLYNPSAPSSGGQTYIDIFAGADYNQQACQNAINIITDSGSNQLDWRNAVYNKNPPPDGCLNSVSGSELSLETKQKIVFQQSVQECWQYWTPQNSPALTVGNDAINTVKNQCPDYLKRCSNNINKSCSKDRDCGTDNQCVYAQPSVIKSGDSALLCSDDYAGYCTSVTNTSLEWVAREYDSPDSCIIAKHNQFCGMMGVPTVVDPTDAPFNSSSFSNLPALLSDLGVEGQLDQPVKTLTVRIKKTDPPKGLVQDFSDLIRFGLMTFNENGSACECDKTGSGISCPKVCSSTRTKSCTNSLDCPSHEPCVATTPNTDNLDGARIVHYIGYVGGTPNESVGSHSSGLIKETDDITATAWTPFAEAFYDATGYFANRTDMRLNRTDFDPSKPPSQYRCQQNHVLLISDGQSTADRRTEVNSLAGLYNTLGIEQTYSGDAWDTCPRYAGSKNIDDLAWLARHRDITNFSKQPLPSEEDYYSRIIYTHVIFTGTASGEAGECNAETLMNRTAANGGGHYYKIDNYRYDQLKQAIYEILLAVTGATSSGTAVSVLANTGEGEGAAYQAFFYPSRKTVDFEAKWTGYLQGLFVDAFGNIREDSNSNRALDLSSDYIIKMWYESGTHSTKMNRYRDNGDGQLKCTYTNGPCSDQVCDSGDTCDDSRNFDEVSPIWEAGKLLFARSYDSRKIYTTLNGNSFTEGVAADEFKGTFHEGNRAVLRPYLGAANECEAGNIINFTRGASISGYRPRSLTIEGTTGTWKLGDIVYSSPSVSGRPAENYDFKYWDTTYGNFKNLYQGRRNVVYIGANDGMLHAFNAGFYDKANHSFSDSSGHSLGEELWAFVPRDLLPHLKWLTDVAYTHVYYVDMKPKVSDVRIFSADSAHPDGWGTILIGGMRFGGKDICLSDDFGSGQEDKTFRSSYFAIDVTDPLSPRLLWTFTDSGLGLTASYPAIVRIGTSSSGEWYAVFGSGPTSYAGSSSLQGSVYALDLNSGTNGQISSWSQGGNYWRFSADSNSFMSDAISVDADADYTHDVVYLGEASGAGGKMLRLVTKGSTPSGWALSTLFNAGRPITGSASVARDSSGDLFVYFGTGRFIDASDKVTTNQQSFYGIKDVCKPWLPANFGCTTTVTNLIDVTGVSVSANTDQVSVPTDSTVTNWSKLLNKVDSKDGWQVKFSHSGERSYVKPLVLGGIVAWATYVPSTDLCSPEGKSYVYAVYYETGTAYKNYVFIEEKTSKPDTVGSWKFLGEGSPSSLVGTITARGTAKGYAQTSTGAIKEFEYATSLGTYGLRGWKSGGIK